MTRERHDLDPLLLKLTITPGLIGLASLVQHRWGPAVGGWLVGLPLTSAPVSLFLAIDQGSRFAATAAGGTLFGLISGGAFCTGYALVARRCRSPLAATAAACLAFSVSTVALYPVGLPVGAAAALVAACLVAMAFYISGNGVAAPPATSPAFWELPVRMVCATLIVLFLTSFAAVLGPKLAGLLSPFQAYACILAVFTHRSHGGHAAGQVMRGAVVGTLGSAVFFTALASLLSPFGTLTAFATAMSMTVVVQAGTLPIVRRIGVRRGAVSSEARSADASWAPRADVWPAALTDDFVLSRAVRPDSSSTTGLDHLRGVEVG
jgi:hypothetical protein